MIKKINIICVYAVIAMMVFVSCNDDDDIKSFEEVETVQRGYFREVVKARDVDRLFKQHGLTDLEEYKNRWCASIGDSLEVFTSFNKVSSSVCIELFLNGKRLIYSVGWFDGVMNIKEGVPLKLNPDKPFFLSADGCKILLPMIYEDGTHYIYMVSATSPGGNYSFWFDRMELFQLNENGIFYMYDADKNLYYLRDIYGKKESATILPECLNDSIMSADRSLRADLDFEQDGEFSIAVRNPSTAEVFYEKRLFLTREAMQELRDNGGRVMSKSISYKESPGKQTSCFELNVLFPNGHTYKYRLNRANTNYAIYTQMWGVTDVEIEYQGHSYTLSESSAEFSDLPCFVVLNHHILIYNEANEGRFRELSLVETNTNQTRSKMNWRFYNGYDEVLTDVLRGYNYVVGQNNGLIAGNSSLTFYDRENLNYYWYYKLLVYDEECPNCLGTKENGCKLSIDFDRALATCPECKRVYDLNCFGVIHDGDDGKRLIRYHYIQAPDESKGVKEDGLIIYGG